MMIFGNQSGQDVNALRELMRRGLLKESDLANLAVSESEPVRAPNALAQMMSPLENATAGQGFQGLASGQGVVQATNPDGTQGAPIRIDSGPSVAQGAPRDWSRVEVDTPNGRGYYGKDGKIYTPDGAVTTMQPVGTQARRNAEQDRLMKMREMEARIRASDANANRDNATVQQMQLNGGNPKPPADMRYDQSGELKPIPGSRLDMKQKQQFQTDKSALDVTQRTTDALIKNINELIGDEEAGTGEHPGLRGSVGYLDSKMPPFNENQANAQALIKGLLSKSSISGLSALRSTGTAPGSITEKEWALFQNYLGTLDPSQGEAQFKQQLKDFRQVTRELQKGAARNYQQRYGEVAPASNSNIPADAINYLRSNPNMRTAFDMKYGQGAAAAALGQ